MSCMLDAEPSAASAVIRAYKGGLTAIENVPYQRPAEINFILCYGKSFRNPLASDIYHSDCSKAAH